MFADFDQTLLKLLEDTTTPPSLTGVEISFAAPDKTFTFTEATLDLFLYGVHENRVLRDPEPILELVGGSVQRRMPPLRVDCDYLVTAWSKKAGAAAVEEEHRILAQALKKLSRFATVPTTYLQGTLVGQPFPIPLLVAQADDSRSLGEFWSALGLPPRSSFHLIATLAMDLEVTAVEGPPVTTREVALHPELDSPTRESVFAIGGVVRDGVTNVVLAAAEVTLDDGATTVTDAAGRFRFSGVAAGQHDLRGEAAGLAPTTKTVTVPAAAINAYDLDLSP
jgi:hypothetical protein